MRVTSIRSPVATWPVSNIWRYSYGFLSATVAGKASIRTILRVGGIFSCARPAVAIPPIMQRLRLTKRGQDTHRESCFMAESRIRIGGANPGGWATLLGGTGRLCTRLRRVRGELLEQFSCLHVIEPDEPVETSGGHLLAVGAKRHRIDWAALTFEPGDQLAVVRLVDADFAVALKAAADDDPGAVGVIPCFEDAAGHPLEDLQPVEIVADDAFFVAIHLIDLGLAV